MFKIKKQWSVMGKRMPDGPGVSRSDNLSETSSGNSVWQVLETVIHIYMFSCFSNSHSYLSIFAMMRVLMPHNTSCLIFF